MYLLEDTACPYLPRKVSSRLSFKMFDRCPETEGEWLSQANAKNIGSLHGHEEFSSASKLPVDQFLALKAIWKFYDINHLANKDWAPRLGTNHAAIQEMRGELKKETAWRLYLDAVPKVLQPNQVFENHLGRFAMVLQNQKIVTKLDDAKHDQLKVVGSPITTRSGLRVQPPVHSTSMLQWQLAKTDDPQPRQPSPARPQSRAGSKAASEYSKAASDVTEGSWFDETLSKAERAKTADEQVVNTAAISFLQSLFVGDTRTAYWTPQRKGFRFGQTDFKAITDGHLQVVGQVRSAAILEVKARKRPDITQKKFEIERQESAQMALWIRDEPSSFWTTPDAPTKCR